MSDYTKDEALWWAVNQMRRAARVLELEAINAGNKALADIYAKGLDQCADKCEEVMDPDKLMTFLAETYPNGRR